MDSKGKIGNFKYWHYVKKQIGKVIKEVKPDIVHAHNIFSAKIISEFELRFIYDDHEYWSQYPKIISEMADTLSWKDKSPSNIIRTIAIGLPVKIRGIIINRYALHLWTNWEKEVVSSAPTITVSDKIAEELRVSGNTDRVFVVPNFPMKSETENIEKPHIHSRLSSVYAGSDGLNKQKIPSRNIDGITDTFINENIGELTIIGWEGRMFV